MIVKADPIIAVLVFVVLTLVVYPKIQENKTQNTQPVTQEQK